MNWKLVFYFKTPLQVEFWSLVQVLALLLDCNEAIPFEQTNNFHEILTNDQNLTYKVYFVIKKLFLIHWAKYKGYRFWTVQSIYIWTFKCFNINKFAIL